jgi:hypothetical protein
VIIDFLCYLFGAIWWCVAAVVITKYAKDGNDDGWDEENWRDAIAILNWVAAAAFVFQAIMFLFAIFFCKDSMEGARYKPRPQATNETPERLTPNELLYPNIKADNHPDDFKLWHSLRTQT